MSGCCWWLMNVTPYPPRRNATESPGAAEETLVFGQNSGVPLCSFAEKPESPQTPQAVHWCHLWVHRCNISAFEIWVGGLLCWMVSSMFRTCSGCITRVCTGFCDIFRRSDKVMRSYLSHECSVGNYQSQIRPIKLHLNNLFWKKWDESHTKSINQILLSAKWP